MTGAEIPAAAIVGKVVEQAGQHAADERKAIGEQLRAAAKDSPHITAAADNYAKRIAIRQAILTKMYKPIAKMFGVANDYFAGEFEQDMAKKMEGVPEESIVAPKASIAAPAMQHLGFSLDEPDLKEMYLSLLTTASDGRRKDDAHPSFVEVIKQLSSEETPLLNRILSQVTNLPMVSLSAAQSDGAQILLQKHVMHRTEPEMRTLAASRLAAFVDNWERLGLVEVTYASYMTADGAYDWVQQSPEYIKYESVIASIEGRTLEYEKGLIRATDFGRAFAKAVGIRFEGNDPK